MRQVFIKRGLQVSGLVVLLIIFLTYQIYVFRLNYEIQNLQLQYKELSEKNEALQIELSKITQPEYLEHYANQQLNMVSPKQVEFIQP